VPIILLNLPPHAVPPLTGETRGTIRERKVRALKPTPFLVNMRRGKLIDEATSVRALSNLVDKEAGAAD
jgi:lactate dehydrogenase-like 2-hydroxyacid dehydrogenase